VAFAPDGKHVYVGANGPFSTLAVYSRDLATGLLTLVEFQNFGVTFGRAVAVSPDGLHVYLCAYSDTLGHRVIAFARDAMTGMLTQIHTYTDGMGGVDGIERPTAIVISPDGNDVYVGSMGDDAIARFRRDAMTGALTYSGMVKDGVGGVTGLEEVDDMALTADSKHLYTAGAGLAVFERDSGTGALTFVESETVPFGTQAVAVSPDGTRVYVPQGGSNLLVFGRNATTGALTPEETVSHPNLESTVSLAVSADSRDVYAHGFDFVSRFRPVELACNPTPATGCFGSSEAGAGTLVLGNDADDVRDKVDWAWRRGEAVPASALGNPIDPVTDYALCVYDAAGGGQLVTSLLVPAGSGCGKPRNEGPKSCWTGNATPQPTKVKYRQPARSPDGVSPVSVISGATGQTRVKLKARGENIPALGLPLTPPVTVQLQNAAGSCWENVFSTPTTNDATTFRATAD
jgi:6-phosphogluconolactonase (cycloisomerase 2 family)